MDQDQIRRDDEQLRALGYRSQLSRVMGVFSAASLGLTYLSPVAGVYALFGLALATGGPPFIWSFLVIGFGQLLVALVFAELGSQYPIAGGIYQWSRRLAGARYGWMTGWTYIWALLLTTGAVAYTVGPVAGSLFDFEPSGDATIAIAIAIIIVSGFLNLLGARVLAMVAKIGLAIELIAAVGLGIWLLLFERVQPLSVVVDSFGAEGDGSYVTAFLASALLITFIIFGFEACGDVAEEVVDPSRKVPRATVLAVVTGTAFAALAALGLLLAVPDIGAVVSGESPDAIGTVLDSAFGATGADVILAMVLLAYVSVTVAIQAAVIRALFSFARDGNLPGSAALSRVSPRFHMPPAAVAVATVVPIAVVLVGALSTDALVKVTSFANAGIYLAFQAVVLSALVARARGWRPTGPWQLRAWAWPVTIGALCYGIPAIVNIVWPRTVEGNTWFDDWIVLITVGVVLGSGLLYLVLARPDQHAPHQAEPVAEAADLPPARPLS
jgi:amino acid transporter